MNDPEAAPDRFADAVIVAQDDQPLVSTARGCAIQPSVMRNQPEVTDLDIALEPWKRVYLPVVLK